MIFHSNKIFAAHPKWKLVTNQIIQFFAITYMSNSKEEIFKTVKKKNPKPSPFCTTTNIIVYTIIGLHCVNLVWWHGLISHLSDSNHIDWFMAVNEQLAFMQYAYHSWNISLKFSKVCIIYIYCVAIPGTIMVKCFRKSLQYSYGVWKKYCLGDGSETQRVGYIIVSNLEIT